MRLGRIHHVAHVVHSIDAALPGFLERYGMTVALRETMTEQAVEAVLLRAGESHVELIQPLDPEGPIARFLEARGEGFHHVAYEVDDLQGALDELRGGGAELIDQAPRMGLGGHLIAFVHPRSGGGVLTELIQAEGRSGAR
ncbi:MAG: methylmalonyl-CoA/ethylmalonyl-CoA epimerase [Miltoncostaeaceae bacterium]|nr:methylmalonyl-CoA/ethylmalonyl-CoA epimerase [Miltoncostaeaceae bacterium]